MELEGQLRAYCKYLINRQQVHLCEYVQAAIEINHLCCCLE